jgi:hypothetical protein
MAVVVIRNGQGIFADVIVDDLRRIQCGDDGNPVLI